MEQMTGYNLDFQFLSLTLFVSKKMKPSRSSVQIYHSFQKTYHYCDIWWVANCLISMPKCLSDCNWTQT